MRKYHFKVKKGRVHHIDLGCRLYEKRNPRNKEAPIARAIFLP
jgi:hypothetical protein